MTTRNAAGFERRVSLKERIVALLSDIGGSTDSELAAALGTRHQAVNQAARQLAEAGRIARLHRDGHLVNMLAGHEPNGMLSQSQTRFSIPSNSTWIVPPLPPAGTTALVGCVKQKLNHSAPASQLYASTLFKRQREWAMARCDSWFILSAKYGLVAPDTVIEPYELPLKALSTSAKRSWSARVLGQLNGALQDLHGRNFEIYAGADYVEFGLVAGLRRAGANVALPWSGLGLGQRIARNEYSR